LRLFPWHRQSGSHVPCKNLVELRAAYMPDVAQAVSGIIAYAASLLVVERLFRIVKPKLMTLPWFASMWNRFTALRGKIVGRFRRARKRKPPHHQNG
jgi:hypothetical protein